MENKKTVKEFIAANSISFNVPLTQEQNGIIDEWSRSIPTIYMLDICVVSATKLTSASLENNPRKSELVNSLRKLDRPNNSFSYLFALMEKVSDSRGIDTDEELEAKILSDLAAMRAFFTEASVCEPDEFILMFFKDLRGNPIEGNRPEYLAFLRELNDQFNLGSPVSPKKRLEIAEKIIERADHFNFTRQHPVVLIGLACLYGNREAKKMMKFKDDPERFDAENVLADIMLITRFAAAKLEIEQLGRNGDGKYLQSTFITDDDGLAKIFKCFDPISVEHADNHDGRETKTTVAVKLKDLLTDIQTEEYNRIIDLLSKN